MNKNKRLVSIALLSASIITFQLALIQVLSIIQWYHFAYMVISMALLGFGAAASILAIFRKKLLEHHDTFLPLLIIGAGVAMPVVTDASQLSSIRFDSYLLFSDYRQVGRLLLTYLLFFIPFFLGALAIGLVFTKYVENIGKTYFVNLTGSAAGGLIALLLTGLVFPNKLPAIIAYLPLSAGAIIITKKKMFLHIGFLLFAAIVVTWKVLSPKSLLLSEYKDLSKTMLLPEAEIKMEKTSPYGVVQFVSSPVLRYAPGLSLTAQKTAKVKLAAFINGDWFGAITDWKGTDSSMILDFTTIALPYIMASRENVLVLQAGTGADVAHAITNNVHKVTAVEGNTVILSILQNQFANETDSIYDHPAVSVHNLESRTFISMDTAHYDLITMPVIGTFGGTSGLYALQEQFILTKEAFREMWHKLNEGGVISVTSWIDYPIRNPLKLLATMVEVLEDAGVKHPRDHIAAIRSWGTITFVLTRTSLQPAQITNINRFCEEMMFDAVILPQSPKQKTLYNQFQGDLFFEYADKIFSSDRNLLFADYDFNIKPATDNQPYFSQFIKWENLRRLSEFFGNRALPFFEVGYLLVMITLIQISIVAFIFILLPLFAIGWKSKGKGGIILYFTGIGLGYMFVEMIFIQRFILYFGTPVYAASAVITSLLIFSGIGSYFSGYFSLYQKRMKMIFISIVALLFTYSFLFTPVLQQTVDLPISIKILIVLLLTAPPAFLMGIPFPAGLLFLSKRNQEVVPWAWGINSCVSVISTVLATVIAVESGFTWVMLSAALAYCAPLLVQFKWR